MVVNVLCLDHNSILKTLKMKEFYGKTLLQPLKLTQFQRFEFYCLNSKGGCVFFCGVFIFKNRLNERI